MNSNLLKDKERIHKIEKSEDSRYISQNKLYKNCFQIDMDYGDIKDWTRRAASNKILRNKAFHIANNEKYN